MTGAPATSSTSTTTNQNPTTTTAAPSTAPNPQTVINGQPVQTTTSIDNSGAVVITGPGFSLAFEDSGRGGEIVLPTGAGVSMRGDGFEPKSPVRLRLASTGQRVGTTTADKDGSFAKLVKVPRGTASGLHQLQIEGVHKSGGTLELSVMVRVDPTEVDTLPSTGTNQSPVIAIGLALMAIGITLAARRRLAAVGN